MPTNNFKVRVQHFFVVDTLTPAGTPLVSPTGTPYSLATGELGLFVNPASAGIPTNSTSCTNIAIDEATSVNFRLDKLVFMGGAGCGSKGNHSVEWTNCTACPLVTYSPCTSRKVAINLISDFCIDSCTSYCFYTAPKGQLISKFWNYLAPENIQTCYTTPSFSGTATDIEKANIFYNGLANAFALSNPYGTPLVSYPSAVTNAIQATLVTTASFGGVFDATQVASINALGATVYVALPVDKTTAAAITVLPNGLLTIPVNLNSNASALTNPYPILNIGFGVKGSCGTCKPKVEQVVKPAEAMNTGNQINAVYRSHDMIRRGGVNDFYLGGRNFGAPGYNIGLESCACTPDSCYNIISLRTNDVLIHTGGKMGYAPYEIIFAFKTVGGVASAAETAFVAFLQGWLTYFQTQGENINP